MTSTSYANKPKVFDLKFSRQAITFIAHTTPTRRKLIGVAKLNLHYFGIAGEINNGIIEVSKILNHTIGYDRKTIRIYGHWVKVFDIRNSQGKLVIRAAYKSAGNHMLDIECIATARNWIRNCSSYEGKILL